jgi:hypothetical protein
LRGHADAETLAAFREELLSRRKAARVSAHLAVCSRCAGLDAQLTEVSALLTATATPPMPDALTARIQAAIAAEAAARAVSAAHGTVAVGAAGAGTGPRDRAARPSRPSGGPGRSRLALRAAAVAAAFVVVAGGGYGVVRLLSGSPEATTSAGGVPAPASHANGKAPLMPSDGRQVSEGQAAAGSSSPHLPVVSSGTNYQPGQLEAQVSAVLARHGVHAAARSGPPPASQPAASLPPELACVPHVTGGKRPLLVDLAKYQGRPATVIVIPGATSGTLRALVVAGACTATTGRVLATTTVPASG